MQEGGGTIKWIKDREDGVGPAGGSARERPRARSLRAAARARGCSPAPTSPPSPSHRPTGRQAGARGGGRVGGSGWRGRATERLPKKRGRGAVPDPVDALLRLRPGPTSGAGGARPRPHTRQGPSLGGWAADGRGGRAWRRAPGAREGACAGGSNTQKSPCQGAFFRVLPGLGWRFPRARPPRTRPPTPLTAQTMHVPCGPRPRRSGRCGRGRKPWFFGEVGRFCLGGGELSCGERVGQKR